MERSPKTSTQQALLYLLKKHYEESAELLIDLLENDVFGQVPFDLDIDGVRLSITENDQKLEVKMLEFLKDLRGKISQRSCQKASESESTRPPIENTIREFRSAISNVLQGPLEPENKALQINRGVQSEEQQFFEKKFGVYPEYAEECLDLYDQLWSMFCIDLASLGSIILPIHFQENEGLRALECIRSNFSTILHEMNRNLSVDMEVRKEELNTILSQGTLQEKFEKIQKLFEDIIGEVFVQKRSAFHQHFFCTTPPVFALHEMEANLWATAFHVVNLQKKHVLPKWEKKAQDLKQLPSLNLRALGWIQIMDWLMEE